MAITLQKLCERANYQYGMRVLAGEKGMDHIVQWVHVVENVEAGGFLRGNELIFTSGIACKGEEWLRYLTEVLIAGGASGLVVNSGPYLPRVTCELTEFCNEQGFPLMEIPWKTRLVDITRDFCNQIIQNDREEEILGETFKNLICYPDGHEKYLSVLENYNFDLNGNYRILKIDLLGPQDRVEGCLRQLHLYAGSELYRSRNQAALFEAGGCLYCVLVNFGDEETEKLTGCIQEWFQGLPEAVRGYLAAGPGQCRLEELPQSCRRTAATMKIARKTGKSPLYYEKLGMEKILVSVDDPGVLDEYYRETLGRLEAYDRENGTGYLELLQKYLIYDGSVQKVADEAFVHRNTVNYQLNKIKKILNMDFGHMEERFRLMMAFRIREL